MTARPLEIRSSPLAPAAPGAVARAEAPTAEPAAATAGTPEPAGTPELTGTPEPAAAPRRSARRVWWAGLAAALLCAGVVSFYASASPDGLEKVAHDKGIDKKTEDHAAKDSRSPTTASRTSPTPGSPAGSPG
ncbi:hypothetical protein SVIO_066190 [Streptomyces violaceusniger]|uniref:PDGLE domain-containing protein n=1 Tax=Streptomyces violaceusniger TaxID=68280 RepID=A0A4D4L9X1_STRVO|nr:hypothetical protein SVIO_066190 [Streptomyces violaceusniger]